RYVTETWGDRTYADDYVNQLMLSSDDSTEGAGDTLTVTLTNRRLISRLKGFLRSENGRLRLSDDAFTSGLAAQKHFLRALFTADASLDQDVLQLKSESLALLQDVQLLLLGFGIKASLTCYGSSEGGAFASGALSDRPVTPS